MDIDVNLLEELAEVGDEDAQEELGMRRKGDVLRFIQAMINARKDSIVFTRTEEQKSMALANLKKIESIYESAKEDQDLVKFYNDGFYRENPYSMRADAVYSEYTRWLEYS